jgi:hypothetical protein
MIIRCHISHRFRRTGGDFSNLYDIERDKKEFENE